MDAAFEASIDKQSPSAVEYRIVVPDGALYLNLYVKSQEQEKVVFPYNDSELETAMMYVNRCFRDYGHMYAYDFETMRLIAGEARFSRIARCSYNEGTDAALLIDSADRVAVREHCVAIAVHVGTEHSGLAEATGSEQQGATSNFRILFLAAEPRQQRHDA